MARIRTIKPEFWDSPGIETLDFQWRLLYVAMWNWADDTGSGKAEARELMGFVFPRDENMTLVEFRRGLGEVHRVFGVKFYKVEGRSFYSIPAWDRHQKIDKRSGSRWPLPSEGVPYDPVTNSLVSPTLENDSWDSAESPPSVRRKVGAGTGEQGNRGTGEQRIKDMLTGDAVERVIDAEIVEDEPKAPTEPNRFEEFWAAYPRKVGKQKCVAKYKAAWNRATQQAIIDGAHRLANDPNLPEQTYVPHATTWLERNGWEDEPLPMRFRTKSDERLAVGMDLAARAVNRPKMINPFEN